MENKIIKMSAVVSAVIPFIFILVSHTSLWPNAFARITDEYVPQGPTKTFSDFVPGNRVGLVINNTREIIEGPVYLLFVPRRHTSYVRVIVEGSFSDEHQMKIGYRSGVGPESNVFVETEKNNGQWVARVPLDQMAIEGRDARRLVFDIYKGKSEKNPVISQVFVEYED